MSITMSFGLFAALFLVVAFIAIAIHAGRSQALFVISVRHGKTKLVRGRIPPSLFEALSDVMRSAQVERATLRVIKDQGRARVEATGLNEWQLQRARNVVGLYPLAKLVTAEGPRKAR